MIYLASPYTHPDPRVREARFVSACSATAKLIRAGDSVFSPVVHGHPLVRFGLPTDWEFWQAHDREFMGCCNEVVVLRLEGWHESAGVQAELAVAAERAKLIRFIDPEA